MEAANQQKNLATLAVAGKLAEALLKGMMPGKLKLAAWLVFVVGLVGLGAGLVPPQFQTQNQTEVPESASTGASREKAESKQQTRTDCYGDSLCIVKCTISLNQDLS
jgi:hypothetical protein